MDDADIGRSVPDTLPGMSIEMPTAEVYGLAHTLRGSADDAEEIGNRLGGRPHVGGPLQAPVEAFLESHRAAGEALIGELRWLGTTVAAIADSWVRLDGTVMPSLGG